MSEMEFFVLLPKNTGMVLDEMMSQTTPKTAFLGVSILLTSLYTLAKQAGSESGVICPTVDGLV